MAPQHPLLAFFILAQIVEIHFFERKFLLQLVFFQRFLQRKLWGMQQKIWWKWKSIIEVDYSEVISGDFIDRNAKISINKAVQRDSNILSLTCSETRDESKAVSNSHDEISFQESRSELFTSSQEVVEQEGEQYIESIYSKCGTLFKRSDKATSICLLYTSPSPRD